MQTFKEYLNESVLGKDNDLPKDSLREKRDTMLWDQVVLYMGLGRKILKDLNKQKHLLKILKERL